MWLGEKIQDKGLGNGTSIIIMVGILSRLPISIIQEFTAKGQKGGGGLLIFLIETAILVAIIMGLIILVQGVRKIPVNYAKQIIGNRQFGGARQFLPVKVNSAGVMPIIFAQGDHVPANTGIIHQPRFSTGYRKNIQWPQQCMVHGYLLGNGNRIYLPVYRFDL